MTGPTIANRPTVKSVADRLEKAQRALTAARACLEVAIRQAAESLDMDHPIRYHIHHTDLEKSARDAILKAEGHLYWLTCVETLGKVEAPTDDQREAIEAWEQAQPQAEKPRGLTAAR